MAGKSRQKKRLPRIPVDTFKRYVGIVRKLRRECPWDRKQTHRSLREGMLEEVYEVLEALDHNDLEGLQYELGDLCLHLILQATIAEQHQEFTLDDVLRVSAEKLIRRHPHVFGKVKVVDDEQVKVNWERLKMEEGRHSVLQGIPDGMPALQRAQRVQERVSKVGFDWKKPEDVWVKVREEVDELKGALEETDIARREEEFGDLLFALVNYARFLDINPESALRQTVRKFTTRFQFIEHALKEQGKKPEESNLEEMDLLWNEAKRKES
jgi:MazG family protein